MLYQLSYLGIPRGLTTTIGRAGYSGVKRSCLPRFAFGFAWRGHVTAGTERVRIGLQGEDGLVR